MPLEANARRRKPPATRLLMLTESALLIHCLPRHEAPDVGLRDDGVVQVPVEVTLDVAAELLST